MIRKRLNLKRMRLLMEKSHQKLKKRRENKEMDKKIADKELEIKMLRGLLRERKEKRFTRRMERRKAVIKEVNIAGVARTSDK